jgi:hypothetical protein
MSACATLALKHLSFWLEDTKAVIEERLSAMLQQVKREKRL